MAEETGPRARILPSSPDELTHVFEAMAHNLPGDAQAEVDEQLAPDERVIAERAMRAGFDLRWAILDAVNGYGSMLVEDYFSDAWVWLEMLALRWRDTEAEFDLEHSLGELLMPVEGIQLLGALEDSFVLSRSAEPERRALALGWQELTVRMDLAGEAATWGSHWEEVAEEAFGQARTGRMRRNAEAGYKRLRRKRLGLRARVQGGMTPRSRALQLARTLDDQALVPVAALYRKLDPDGRARTEGSGRRAAGRSRVQRRCCAGSTSSASCMTGGSSTTTRCR